MDNENKQEDQNNFLGNLNININFYAIFSALKRYFKQIIVVVAAVIAIFIFTRPNLCGGSDAVGLLKSIFADSVLYIDESEFDLTARNVDRLYREGNTTGCVADITLSDGIDAEQFTRLMYTVTRRGRQIYVEITQF